MNFFRILFKILLVLELERFFANEYSYTGYNYHQLSIFSNILRIEILRNP